MSQVGSRRAGLTAVAALAIAGVAAFVVACNPNPVEYLSSAGQIIETVTREVSGQTKMDILWVIDNSGSMCQEQEVLRKNFDKFIEALNETSLDFHIGVTTTHFPEGVSYVDPVAIPFQLQSVPQPLPGRDPACREGTGTYDPNLLDDMVEERESIYLPLQEALAVARSCLKPEVDANQFVWRDGQIGCALSNNTPGAGCDAADNIPDRNGVGGVNVEDLFPQTIVDYKTLDKVLRAIDYTNAEGVLDIGQLRRDFACMASVGTQGYGIEKGLRAAVNAVSLANTGGAVGKEGGADDTAPNHGLIRRDAGFTLVFVTDENDCSHDGQLNEMNQDLNGSCKFEDGLCEIENGTQIGASSRLTSPEALANELRKNLAETKGVEKVEDEDLVMAGIFGTWKRFEGPYPDCSVLSEADRRNLVTPTCNVSGLGSADSGDRYERFIRQFKNFFPNNLGRINEENRTNFDVRIAEGEICKPSGFSGALQAIGQFISGTQSNCIRKRVLPCEIDADCPMLLGSEDQGRCIASGLVDGKDQGKFCTSGVTLKLTAVSPGVPFDEVASTYCLAGSENFFDNEDNANCVVAYDKYTVSACSDGPGIEFKWNTDTATVVRALDANYILETIYTVDPNPLTTQTPAPMTMTPEAP